MSVQQDRRVVKPSKMSERYARWFGTRVPSTSRMFRYMIMLALAIPWSLIVYVLPSSSLMNLILVFLFTCGVGAAIYFLCLSILENRFRSPIVNEQFSQIVELAHERVGSHGLAHVWQRRSSDPYIVSTFNSLFNAVIVSESMIDLILKMPASGEALLGFHLLHRPSRRNILDIIAAVSMFSGSSIYLALLLRLYEPVFLFTPLLLPILLPLPLGILFFEYAFFFLLFKGVFWTHDSAFERAVVMYKVHPQVARDEVLSSSKLDEEAAKAVVWVVKEWEQSKRNGRRLGITTLVFGITYFLILFSAMTGRHAYTYAFILSMAAPAAAFLLAFSIYLLLRRCDKICMGEIYHETTKAHEPIWAD